MHMLSWRLQVMIDAGRELRLRRASRQQGAPVGELVRRAIDREYPPTNGELTRAEAAEKLLAGEMPPDAEPDWEDQKDSMLDELGARSVTR